MTTWQPIDTAPKEPDSTGLTPKIILGFAPDEENWTLESCEGHWSPEPWKERGPCFVSSVDPDDPQEPAQPTHWMPLPDPPKEQTRRWPDEVHEHMDELFREGVS